MNLKSANTPAQPKNQDHFTKLRAQADRERVRARRGQGQDDLLAQTSKNAHSGLYSDEMVVDAPAQNTQKKNNQRRGRR
jgi:hypothetical protein